MGIHKGHTMMVQKQMVVAGQQRMAESVLENQMKGIELRERRFEKHLKNLDSARR